MSSFCQNFFLTYEKMIKIIVEILFRLGELIYNSDGINMLRFADQTHNFRKL